MDLRIRHATEGDVAQVTELIAVSARELGREFYTNAQIEDALGTAWGIDSQLIRDRTFFVVFAENFLVACGGWSKRKARFGADSVAGSEAELLDPVRDPARIRAFFVHPKWARRGIGKMLLERCEAEARVAGFRAAELVATLPGERLYATCGYRALPAFDHPLKRGGTIKFVPMRKESLILLK